MTGDEDQGRSLRVSTHPHPSDLRRRPPRLTVCGSCRQPFGPDRKPTKDHVLPYGFFSKPVPSNLPTWRVCEACQDLFDPAEERLRNLFVRGPSHNPQLYQDVFERAQRSSRVVVPEKWDWVMNHDDLREFSPIARADQADLDIVFSKMAGGLFYWKHHRLRPTTTQMVVRGPISRDAFDYWSRVVQFELKLSVQHVGRLAWVAESDPDLRSGFWMFMLHDALGVWAGEMAARPDLPKSSAFPVRL